MTVGKRSYDVAVYKPEYRTARTVAASPEEAAIKAVAAFAGDARTMVEVSWTRPDGLPQVRSFIRFERGAPIPVEGRVY